MSQTGRTIIIAPGIVSGALEADYDLNIYETVDSVSEQYDSAGEERDSSSSFYENPDEVISEAGSSLRLQSSDPGHHGHPSLVSHSACDYFYCSLE